MTGVSPFLFFHKHTIITIKDATLMAQSFTNTSQGRRDEYGEYEIIEYDGYAIKYYELTTTLAYS